MDAATVSRTLSLIPERIARLPSGRNFDPKNCGCAHPERVAHLVQFLDWLTPLRAITKDDLRVFGLMTPYGKPAIGSVMDEEAELDAEADTDAELESELEIVAESQPAASTPETEREPALT